MMRVVRTCARLRSLDVFLLAFLTPDVVDHGHRAVGLRRGLGRDGLDVRAGVRLDDPDVVGAADVARGADGDESRRLVVAEHLAGKLLAVRHQAGHRVPDTPLVAAHRSTIRSPRWPDVDCGDEEGFHHSRLGPIFSLVSGAQSICPVGRGRRPLLEAPTRVSSPNNTSHRRIPVGPSVRPGFRPEPYTIRPRTRRADASRTKSGNRNFVERRK